MKQLIEEVATLKNGDRILLEGFSRSTTGFHSSMTPLGLFGISALLARIVNTTSPCAGICKQDDSTTVLDRRYKTKLTTDNVNRVGLSPFSSFRTRTAKMDRLVSDVLRRAPSP